MSQADISTTPIRSRCAVLAGSAAATVMPSQPATDCQPRETAEANNEQGAGLRSRVSLGGNQAGHRLLYSPGKAAIVVLKIDDVKNGHSD